VLADAIRAIEFGTLVSHGAGGLEANHLPMLIEVEPSPFGTLHGHMARANGQWQSIAKGSEVLCLFLGPHCYVSPSHYPSKSETGKVVPTWNYLAVHAYGAIAFYDEAERLKDHLAHLTDVHESGRDMPWALGDAPSEYIDSMVHGIVGFTIVLTRLEGKWKMSQNRLPKDVEGVRRGLANEDGCAQKTVAAVMNEIYGTKG
jgi:transcriptional regulator